MLKKIIFYLSVLATVIMGTMAYAYEPVEPVSNPEIGLLTGLGVFDAEIESGNEITRGEFAKALARLTGYNDEDYIGYLSGMGVMSGNGNGDYRENDVITGNEALKMLVVTLGYDTAAQYSGGYPAGYYTTACEIDIADRNISGSEGLTYSKAAELLVNTGNSAEADVTVNTGSSTLTIESHDTLFYKYHSIKSYEGIVNANDHTDFDGGSGLYNQIMIGDFSVEVGETSAGSLLGCYVKCYYVSDKTGDVALYAYPVEKKNNIVMLTHKNEPVATGNLSEFSVEYYDENGKTKRIDVKDFYPFRNGKYDTAFVLSDIDELYGKLEFIDNDNDNAYEVVKVYNYENYIVQSVDTDREMVFAKYGKSLKFDPDCEKCEIIRPDGQKGTIKDITGDSMISVMQSRDGEIIIAYIVNEVASGVIESISGNDRDKTIGFYKDRYYTLSDELENCNHPDKIEPELGMHVQLNLDLLGEIADITLKVTATTWQYGYVISANIIDDESGMILKLFTQDERMIRFPLNERVNIDGVSKKGDAIKQSLLDAQTGKAVRQLIRYKLLNGYITDIDTVAPDAPYDSGTSLQLLEGVRDKVINYNADTMYFYNGIETVVGADESTIVFSIPISSEYYDDITAYQCTHKGSFGTESTFNKSPTQYLEAYNVDEAMVADVMIKYQDRTGNPAKSAHSLFVKEVQLAIDSEGEVANKIIGTRLSDGAEINMFAMEGAYTFEPEFGDIIRYSTYKNKIWKANLDFDRNADAHPEELLKYSNGNKYTDETNLPPGAINTYTAGVNIYYGKLHYSNETHMTVAADTDDMKRTSFLIREAPVYVCDIDAESLIRITASELRAYEADNNPNAGVYVVTLKGVVYAVVVFIGSN